MIKLFYSSCTGKECLLTEVRSYEVKFKQPRRRIEFILEATMSWRDCGNCVPSLDSHETWPTKTAFPTFATTLKLSFPTYLNNDVRIV